MHPHEECAHHPFTRTKFTCAIKFSFDTQECWRQERLAEVMLSSDCICWDFLLPQTNVPPTFQKTSEGQNDEDQRFHLVTAFFPFKKTKQSYPTKALWFNGAAV